MKEKSQLFTTQNSAPLNNNKILLKESKTNKTANEKS